MNKPFDQETYDENDFQAKSCGADFLFQMFRFLPEPPLEQQKERFKTGDFWVRDPDTQELLSIEVERKLCWTLRGCWQGFSTIHIPARKQSNPSNLFLMLNKPMNTLCCIDMQEVRNAEVIQKDTYIKVGDQRSLMSGEKFLEVPVEKFKFFAKKYDFLNPSLYLWTAITPLGRRIQPLSIKDLEALAEWRPSRGGESIDGVKFLHKALPTKKFLHCWEQNEEDLKAMDCYLVQNAGFQEALWWKPK